MHFVYWYLFTERTWEVWFLWEVFDFRFWGLWDSIEKSLIFRFSKRWDSFDKSLIPAQSCEIPVRNFWFSLLKAVSSCHALKRLTQRNPGTKTKKKQTQQNANKHIDISKCCACHGFRRYNFWCRSRNILNNICFCVAFVRMISRFCACCNRLQSKKSQKFLEFLSVRTTYMTSSCTQRPPRPGYYDAKCSCMFPVSYHCLDFFLF